MAKIKKAQAGKKVAPTYKNLRMGVANERAQVSGEYRGNVIPTSRDSARYRGGFEQGLKGMKGGKGEGEVEKMGRWEGQNVKPKSKVSSAAPKKVVVEEYKRKSPFHDFKKGGVTKKKMQAGGVAGKQPKAGMVDPQGAYTKVQQRTLGSMKKGGTVKAKDGKWIQKAINPKHKGFCTPMTKKTCTPKRKALAMTLKKMAKSRKGK